MPILSRRWSQKKTIHGRSSQRDFILWAMVLLTGSPYNYNSNYFAALYSQKSEFQNSKFEKSNAFPLKLKNLSKNDHKLKILKEGLWIFSSLEIVVPQRPSMKPFTDHCICSHSVGAGVIFPAHQPYSLSRHTAGVMETKMLELPAFTWVV